MHMVRTQEDRPLIVESDDCCLEDSNNPVGDKGFSRRTWQTEKESMPWPLSVRIITTQLRYDNRIQAFLLRNLYRGLSSSILNGDLTTSFQQQVDHCYLTMLNCFVQRGAQFRHSMRMPRLDSQLVDVRTTTKKQSCILKTAFLRCVTQRAIPFHTSTMIQEQFEHDNIIPTSGTCDNSIMKHHLNLSIDVRSFPQQIPRQLVPSWMAIAICNTTEQCAMILAEEVYVHEFGFDKLIVYGLRTFRCTYPSGQLVAKCALVPVAKAYPDDIVGCSESGCEENVHPNGSLDLLGQRLDAAGIVLRARRVQFGAKFARNSPLDKLKLITHDRNHDSPGEHCTTF
ncbi:hypothetical protein LTR86_007001 [Recurvomyces mirabilis]|nr:hypothetical protein LTR86_007001 [Recurvomyces mirabilis]